MSQLVQPSLDRRFAGLSPTCTCQCSCRQGTIDPSLHLHPLLIRPFLPLTSLLGHFPSFPLDLPLFSIWAHRTVILVMSFRYLSFRIVSRVLSSFIAPFAFEVFLVLSLRPSTSVLITSGDHPCRPISAMTGWKKAPIATSEGLERLSDFSSSQFVISKSPF